MDMQEDYSTLTELEAVMGCLVYVVVAVWALSTVVVMAYLLWRWVG